MFISKKLHLKNRSLYNYDRQIIGELFEQWLSAGEDWLKSSLVCNASRSLQQRKKGRYVMMDVKTLRTRFGNALGKLILQEKREQQQKKDPSDPLTYWMKHPDVPHEA